MDDVIISPSGTTANPITEITDALLAQVYIAAQQGYIDINRLALGGHSYGGYSTASVVSQTRLFRAGIPIEGTYDLPGGYSYKSSDGLAPGVQWTEAQGRMGGHRWMNLTRYIDNSP